MTGFMRSSINPSASRQDLAPQIHALLSDHQKELEKAVQQRERNGPQSRPPTPPAGSVVKGCVSAVWISFAIW
jgi:hypothetical protein